MKRMALVEASAWLAAGLAGAGAASAGMAGAQRHDAPIHDRLAPETVAKQVAETAAGQAGGPRVSEASARRIAWRSGVDHIEEIVLSGERWEVAGRDRTGNEKTLDIHAHDGSVMH